MDIGVFGSALEITDTGFLNRGWITTGFFYGLGLRWSNEMCTSTVGVKAYTY
jgi:hypothetical protein